MTTTTTTTNTGPVDKSTNHTSRNDDSPDFAEKPATASRSSSKRRLTKQERKKMNRMKISRKEKEATTMENKRKEGEEEELSSEAANNKKRKNKKKKNKATSNRHQQQPIPEDGQDEGDDVSKQQPQQEEEDDESVVLERSLKSYEPIEIPTTPSANILADNNKNSSKQPSQKVDQDQDHHEGGGRSLGKWFPSAILVKCQVHYTNTGQKIVHNISKKKENNTTSAQSPVSKKDVTSSTPKAVPPKASLALFYQYTDPKSTKWSKRQLQLLMTYLQTIATKRNIGGRIRVAPEGVNATLSAVDDDIKGDNDGGGDHGLTTAQETLRHVAEDLKRFDTIFKQTDFKFIDHLSPDRHFKELKILPVQELVFYDIQSNEAPLVMEDKQTEDTFEDSHQASPSSSRTAPGKTSVKHLDAKEYHEMLQKDNTVVIDVRNHYEAILGRFDGQMKTKQNASSQAASSDQVKNSNESPDAANDSTASGGGGGAEYIDPKMRKSTDFKEWLSKDETKQKIKGKTVMMFCTGGIRCERASVYLKGKLGEEVGNVYQLQGGIERYLKAFPDGGMWTGKNFTFDKREAVGVDCPDGDGGVVRRKNKKSKSKSDGLDGGKDNSTYVAKCCICDKPWDRYVGKKKCVTCGVPVLVCDSCLSKKPDKTPGMELKMRCPLCVEENITVLASQVEFTDNGIHGKHNRNGEGNASGGGDTSAKGNNKAAGSVLKWGGGHAQQKKQRKKFKRTLCRFGSECVRKDCFFYHPDNNRGTTTNNTSGTGSHQEQPNNKKTK